MNRLVLSLTLVLSACVTPEREAPEREATATSQRAALFTGTGSIADEVTIYEDGTTENGGGYSEICVGNLASTVSTRRAFVRYALPSIPAGATVTRVQMSFAQEAVRLMGAGPLSATLQLHRVSGAWTEGTGAGSTRSCGGGQAIDGVTWTTMPSTGTLSASIALPSTNMTVNLDSNNGSQAGLIDDVQSWIDGGENHGWALRVSDESVVDTARSIRPGAFTVSYTLANGGACTTDGDCTSGNCVGSNGADCGGGAGCVCCDAPTCTGICETCHRATMIGTCSPKVAGGACRTASCTGGVATAAATCTGDSRTCPAAVQTPCSPYVCSGNACGTSCSSPAHCAATYACNPDDECVSSTNECALQSDDCVVGATCSDPSAANGDYTCTCPVGYVGNGRSSGSGCSDLDECMLELDDCDENATCTDTDGAFFCTCLDGWMGPGTTCTAVDPCPSCDAGMDADVMDADVMDADVMDADVVDAHVVDAKVIDADDDAGSSPQSDDAGSEPPSGGDGGSNAGSGSVGGAGGTDVRDASIREDVPARDAGPDAGTSVSESTGCDCRTMSSNLSLGSALPFVAAMLVLLRRRRRARGLPVRH